MVAAYSSAGVAPASWAAVVDPEDVPMVRSAVVTSSPASKRPATTPITQALPADPPPPRTSARSVECRDEEGVVFMGVAFRELRVGRSRWRLPQSRDRGLAGERPLWILRSWDSPPADGSRSLERYHACRRANGMIEPANEGVAHGTEEPGRSRGAARGIRCPRHRRTAERRGARGARPGSRLRRRSASARTSRTGSTARSSRPSSRPNWASSACSG